MVFPGYCASHMDSRGTTNTAAVSLLFPKDELHVRIWGCPLHDIPRKARGVVLKRTLINNLESRITYRVRTLDP